MIPIPDRPIAIIVPQYATSQGGIERYVERLAVGLVQRRAAVEIVTPTRKGESATTEEREGVVVHRLSLSGIGRSALQSTGLMPWLYANAKRFSVLNAHNLHSSLPLLTSVVARTTGVPLVLTGHWHGEGRTVARQLLHIPYRPLAMWTARSAAAVIYNSQAERELLERQLGVDRTLAYIPEGTDLGPIQRSREQPAADPDGVRNRQTILCVGRLQPYKGTKAVVRALGRLPSDYRLVIVGEGPARAAIEDTASAVGVVDRVVFRGSCSDEELRDWYARAAVCVSLSAQESFGLVVLEAAAAGCPVVASNIAAHRDLTAFVPPGRLFFVARDAPPEDVAEAVREAAHAGRLNGSERSAADGWHLPTWEGLVEETLRVIARVTDSARGAAQ